MGLKGHHRGLVVEYRASKSQVWGSILGLGNIESTFYSFSGSINEYQACLGTKHWVSLWTDHLMWTYAHAPQRSMVSYTEMGSVGIDPHGLLRR
ncbi:hypothetical protein TNCV_1322561 [Trichonephila clavipes]|nr:hypothetical protein TNCV_1322561 [Trichonephila clavipes]